MKWYALGLLYFLLFLGAAWGLYWIGGGEGLPPRDPATSFVVLGCGCFAFLCASWGYVNRPLGK